MIEVVLKLDEEEDKEIIEYLKKDTLVQIRTLYQNYIQNKRNEFMKSVKYMKL